jgi:hypothetical protein
MRARLLLACALSSIGAACVMKRRCLDERGDAARVGDRLSLCRCTGLVGLAS